MIVTLTEILRELAARCRLPEGVVEALARRVSQPDHNNEDGEQNDGHA